MKPALFVCLFAIISCSHQRGPASVSDKAVAKDSIALGNVQATATKSVEAQNVCFDIALSMTGVEREDASTSNWTLAWIDQDSKYHFLSLNQRDPASIPQGGTKIAPYGYYQEWKNTFRTCAPKAKLGDVKALILTPKELPYKESEGLRLEWN